MLEPHHYACQNWLITPAAPATGEPAAADMKEQSFLLVGSVSV
jgi:hypothetical protein